MTISPQFAPFPGAGPLSPSAGARMFTSAPSTGHRRLKASRAIDAKATVGRGAGRRGYRPGAFSLVRASRTIGIGRVVRRAYAGVACVRGGDPRPEAFVLVVRRSACRHRSRARPDRDRRPGLLTQVQPPGGRSVFTAVRRDDHEVVAVLEIRERRRPRAPRPAACRREQQHRHARNAAEQSTTGQPVDRPMTAAHGLDRDATEPHARRYRVTATARCRAGRASNRSTYGTTPAGSSVSSPVRAKPSTEPTTMSATENALPTR